MDICSLKVDLPSISLNFVLSSILVGLDPKCGGSRVLTLTE